jgi:glyoxylase-like metal-dependent hydrolase (beta-lactamase superfamily II)
VDVERDIGPRHRRQEQSIMLRTTEPDDAVDLGGLSMTRLVVGPMSNNAYLLEDPRTGALALVDAADEAPRLLGAVGKRPLATVVTTHRHADHVQALGAVVAATSAVTVAGEPDAAALPVPTGRAVTDDDLVEVGHARLRVVRLTGHTAGGIALVHDGRPAGGVVHVFTGDSLFPGGVGRTGSPEDFATLLTDVRTKLFDGLPDDTQVWPGHGDPTTLGAERPHLTEWADRGW